MKLRNLVLIVCVLRLLITAAAAWSGTAADATTENAMLRVMCATLRSSRRRIGEHQDECQYITELKLSADRGSNSGKALLPTGDPS